MNDQKTKKGSHFIICCWWEGIFWVGHTPFQSPLDDYAVGVFKILIEDVIADGQ